LSVKLRMKRMGTKKRPFWRIVAIDSRMSRDGRFIEILGHYNPMVEPPVVKVDEDRVYHWLDRGALPSQKVEQLLKRLGLMERWRLLRAGVTIQELDAKIAERRTKQPKAAEGKTKKARPGKKKAAKAAAEKAAAEAATASAAPKAEETKA
jgi:small subunit ribosomal protein S16